MTTNTRKRTDEILDKAGFRRTGPRQAILAVLLNADRPVTAEQIAEKIGRSKPNKVTIYRALENFIEAAIVHKAFLRDRTWHFELANRCTDTQCHPHFTCTNCGDTHCMPGISMPMAKSPYKGFAIVRQRVQFEGLCPPCALKVRKVS